MYVNKFDLYFRNQYAKKWTLKSTQGKSNPSDHQQSPGIHVIMSAICIPAVFATFPLESN